MPCGHCGSMDQAHRVGTAGWRVDRRLPVFRQEGIALERYASVFSAVEVNTSFYRRHRRDTWQRWHDAVPPDFRFSVKLVRTVTHERGLVGAAGELDAFFDDVAPLGTKLGAILVQLPPKLAFDPDIAARFLGAMRQRSAAPVFIEPRHASWATDEVSMLLAEHRVGRVLADPQGEALRAAAVAEESRYLRLHGSPKIYYSDYSEDALRHYAHLLAAGTGPGWCIFDNTASGAATRDALQFREMISASP